MKIDGNVYDLLHKETKINRNLLKNYVYGNSTMSKGRALLLEEVCFELGIDISAEQWIFGTPRYRKQILRDFTI